MNIYEYIYIYIYYIYIYIYMYIYIHAVTYYLSYPSINYNFCFDNKSSSFFAMRYGDIED